MLKSQQAHEKEYSQKHSFTLCIFQGMGILLTPLIFLFLIDVKADDFEAIFALINSKPQFEHFPLIMALPLASLA
jgi:hypothetical protein